MMHCTYCNSAPCGCGARNYQPVVATPVATAPAAPEMTRIAARAAEGENPLWSIGKFVLAALVLVWAVTGYYQSYTQYDVEEAPPVKVTQQDIELACVRNGGRMRDGKCIDRLTLRIEQARIDADRRAARREADHARRMAYIERDRAAAKSRYRSAYRASKYKRRLRRK